MSPYFFIKLLIDLFPVRIIKEKKSHEQEKTGRLKNAAVTNPHKQACRKSTATTETFCFKI